MVGSPEPNRSESYALMNTMSLHIGDFARELASYYELPPYKREKPLRRGYNRRGMDGYRLVVTSTATMGVARIEASCGDSFALGLLLRYLEREYVGRSEAVNLHVLRGEYQLLDNPPA